MIDFLADDVFCISQLFDHHSLCIYWSTSRVCLLERCGAVC